MASVVGRCSGADLNAALITASLEVKLAIGNNSGESFHDFVRTMRRSRELRDSGSVAR